MRSALKWIVLVPVAVFIAACSSTEAGVAGPAPQSGSTASSTSATAESTAPRPRSFDLSNVNPCDLLTTEQWAMFDINRAPVGPSQVVDGVTQCTYSPVDPLAGNAFYTYGIFVDNSQGASDAVASSVVDGTNQEVTVGGFPTILSSSPQQMACYAIADTGEAQNLTIQVGATATTDISALCSLAQPFLETALANLAVLQP